MGGRPGGTDSAPLPPPVPTAGRLVSRPSQRGTLGRALSAGQTGKGPSQPDRPRRAPCSPQTERGAAHVCERAYLAISDGYLARGAAPLHCGGKCRARFAGGGVRRSPAAPQCAGKKANTDADGALCRDAGSCSAVQASRRQLGSPASRVEHLGPSVLFAIWYDAALTGRPRPTRPWLICDQHMWHFKTSALC